MVEPRLTAVMHVEDSSNLAAKMVINVTSLQLLPCDRLEGAANKIRFQRLLTVLAAIFEKKIFSFFSGHPTWTDLEIYGTLYA